MKVFVGMKFKREVRYFKDLFVITAIVGRTIEFRSLDNPSFTDRWRSSEELTTEYLNITPVLRFKDYIDKL